MCDKNMCEGGGCGCGMGAKMHTKKFLSVFLIVASLFLLVKTVNEIGEERKDVTPSHVISVNGKGEVLVVADVATFNFSVTESSKLVADAQKKATDKTNKVLEFLKSKKIDDKDVKTAGYNIYPKYEYNNTICTEFSCPQRQILTGYEVSQSVDVKVRDIAQAGDILAGIGGLNVQNVSGLSFLVDKQDDLMKDARSRAIADAQLDAERIAKDLGVRLVRVVSMNEDSGGRGGMMMFAKSEMSMDSSAVRAPQIPVGENKIV